MQCQIGLRVRSPSLDIDPQPVLEISNCASVQGQEDPGPDPVEASGQSRPHGMSRNGVVKGFSEPAPVGIAATVGVLQCIGEDTPERVHVVAGARVGIREEPGIEVIQRGDPLEGIGNRLLYAQELRQPARYPPSVFVGDPPVEEAEGGERADVL